MTDRVTEHYVQQCLRDRELREAVGRARLPEAFEAVYRDRLLPRPVFIDEPGLRSCADDLIALYHLLASLPERLFAGDAGAYCRTVGIDARRAELMQRFPAPPGLYGRADLYHDGESFKLLEYNLDSALGGTDWSEVCRALLEVDAFRGFAEQQRLHHVHTGERIAQLLRELAGSVNGEARPVVAFVEGNGTLQQYLPRVRALQEMLGRLGIELLLGELNQVSSRGGRLHLHGRPVDVVLRYFSVDEMLTDRDSEQAAETIFQAYEAGTTALWTTLRSLQVFNKGCMSLLSDTRSRAAFTDEELALVDRILPWTRTLAAGQTEVGGESVDLVDYCQAHRDELILKSRTGYGGEGIVVGWQVSDADWKDALSTGQAQGHVVQRRVQPRTEPVVDPATSQIEDWVAVWGCFVTPDGYAGAGARALPEGGGAVISMAASARIAGVFSYPAAT